MSRNQRVAATNVGEIEDMPASGTALSAPSLLLAALVAADGDGLVVDLGGHRLPARRDPSVHPELVAGALARRERVVVERVADGTLAVVGALRTQPTPGVDRATEYRIEADRVEVRGDEIHLATAAATLVLRAAGEIESYAERIVARAEGVHELVGRLLRLN